MGSNGEFGPDTDAIRAWLEKRKSYADDDFVARHRGDQILPEMPSATAVPPGGPMPAPVVEPTRMGPDGRDVGRSVLAALAEDEAIRREAIAREADGEVDREVEVSYHRSGGLDTRTPTPAAPRREPTPSRWTEPARLNRASTTDVEFKPRGAARRIASMILLLCLAGTGLAGYLAATDPTQTNLALLIGLAVVTMVVWATRTGMSTVQLAIRRGHLEVRRGSSVESIDLGNPYTPVAVLGDPGDRGWCVLIERFDKPLFVVSPRLVEPAPFIEALFRLRPDVANGPKFRPR